MLTKQVFIGIGVMVLLPAGLALGDAHVWYEAVPFTQNAGVSTQGSEGTAASLSADVSNSSATWTITVKTRLQPGGLINWGLDLGTPTAGVRVSASNSNVPVSGPSQSGQFQGTVVNGQLNGIGVLMNDQAGYNLNQGGAPVGTYSLHTFRLTVAVGSPLGGYPIYAAINDFEWGTNSPNGYEIVQIGPNPPREGYSYGGIATPGGEEPLPVITISVGGPPPLDTDSDGVPDLTDNCPTIPNTNQANSDADTFGDACDNCPSITNQNQLDTDGDGRGNVCDNCPITSNSNQLDTDGDGVGDACDNCVNIPNADQINSDGDDVGNACDNCPNKPNPGQEDCDDDGVGDACESDCNSNAIPDECEIDTQIAKLLASDAAADDYFGYSSVAVSGDTALVGAYHDDHAGGTDAGSAYVFVRTGGVWTQQQKLTASDAATNDRFGISVAVSGDTAVVGADFDDHAGGTNAGSAYVFVRSGGVWAQQQKLTASDAAGSDYFGFAVAMSGETAVVGAWQDSHAGGTGAGSAYFFTRTGGVWTQQAKRTASDAAAFDNFGASVAISGDTALVGARQDDLTGGANAGSAYVFTRSGGVWTQQAKLTASDAAATDYFGHSVTVSGDTAVVGAVGDDHAGGSEAGSAYAFVRPPSGWANMTQTAKLTASDAAAGDDFGRSVAISGDMVVVGADADSHVGGAYAGSVYAFLRIGGVWTERAKLTASDAANSDLFGQSVAFSGDTVVVGAYLDDHAGGTDAGSAYVFSFEDCNGNSTPDVCEPDTDSDSIIDVCDNCPGVTNPTQADSDSDGVGDACDNCPTTPNPTQVDTDSDGIGDACDGCPNDPYKTSPGVCGCGVSDSDSDSDGWADCVDNCPNIANPSQADVDSDGLGDFCDNCPNTPNPSQVDYDSDGVGDDCDNCPVNGNPGQEDCSSNGVGDACEPIVTRFYVDKNATGLNNGSGWADAFTELDWALFIRNCPPNIANVTEIWAADGTYKPNVGPGSQANTFQLRNNLAIYGGFAGGETMLSERDPAANIAVLSGDLNGDDGPNFTNYDDNSFHVVTTYPEGDSTAVLDGFVITAGNASAGFTSGGGLWVSGNNPTIVRCIFVANRAVGSEINPGEGGAISKGILPATVMNVVDCKFLGNRAEASLGQGGVARGGAAFGFISFTNCVFSGNSAIGHTARGGGMNGEGELVNCTFSGNSCVGTVSEGGGAFSTGPQNGLDMTNCVVVGNTAAAYPQIGSVPDADVSYSCVQGGYAGTGNINVDPLFADADGPDNILGTLDDDLRILAGSPCIDAANTPAVPADSADVDGDANTSERTPLDLAGDKREVDDPYTSDTGIPGSPVVDMGAYEYFPDCNNNGIDDADDILLSPEIDDTPADGVIDSCCFCAAAGVWSDNGTWNCGNPPNNGFPLLTDRYNVNITCPVPAVVLDIPVTIDSVVVQAGQALSVTGGNLTIDSAGGIHNDGGLTVGAGKSVVANTACVLEGATPIQMIAANATLSSNSNGAVITNTATVAGQGVISAALTNSPIGVVRANVSGAMLSVTGSRPKSNLGLLEATNGGTLEVSNTTVTGNKGKYRADGGTIVITPGAGATAIDGGLLEAVNGGVVQVEGAVAINLNVSGTVMLDSGGIYQGAPFSSASLTAGLVTINSNGTGGQMLLSRTMGIQVIDAVVVGCGSFLRGCTPPVLAVTGDSTLDVDGNLNLQGRVEVSIDSSQPVTLAGNFENFSTDASIFDWQGQLTLDGADPQTFELAGFDYGPRDPDETPPHDGFVDNFAMGTLRIEPGRTVDFINAFDNLAGPGCEVLYVQTLSLGAGSTIRLNGCFVYYDVLIKEPLVAVQLQGGALMSTQAGDLDNVGGVDLNDAATLASYLVGNPCSPTCQARADLNGDGVVDGRDISLMIRLLTGW